MNYWMQMGFRLSRLCPIAIFATALFGLSATTAGAQDEARPLFDGESLDGWNVIAEDRQWWQVTDGKITGGSLTKKIPHNTFIATDDSFQNFDLRLKIRIRGTEGFINSGIQIRSIRLEDSHEMSGYQVDAGDGWWGKLYDESRRNKVISEAADLDAVKLAVRKDDWNEFRIRAEGPRIRSWINGVPALDFTETDPHIPLDGHIGIQAHGGGKALVEIKDVTIEELPPTPNAASWEQIGERESTDRTDFRTPEEERQGFKVPDGFEVELVASEADGIGKFVAIHFDSRGRMWTMTALEYPVDANESPEASRRLFEQGGRDKVLVFDRPFDQPVSEPCVFADGLVMPLGILPYKDGVYVQYGPDIRFYRDTDGDGRADQHEVVLTGFGTQDSHLFPHQFTRAPGGWILLAQGLFNYSTVRRPAGLAFADGTKEIPFNQCKLARFSHDGSQFEALTAGPNNIWGLTTSREGETWIQEANDLGYPIIPYAPGGHYPTGSPEKLRPYQPMLPPTLTPAQMGGTGLSGLALADDADGWPTPWGARGVEGEDFKTFYVANPITSRIQIIRATPAGDRYEYTKQPDFLISEDPHFRPVAIEFGPDGCLYVVDWYNKIISHNEVPRSHPERDKTSGRIWRIRHSSQRANAQDTDAQGLSTPPNLAGQPDGAIVDYLGAPNTHIAALAWQEIIDRGATDLQPVLEQLATSDSEPVARRLGALWALEGLGPVPISVLITLADDADPNLRREAIRVAVQLRSESDFLRLAEPFVDDPSARVRAALGDTLRHIGFSSPKVAALMVRLGRAPLPGNSWDAYEREFERFLARWAMERSRPAVLALLNSPAGRAMPLENRVLATLALEPRDAALALASLASHLDRPLVEEEVRVLATQFHEPDVATAIQQSLQRPDLRNAMLRALLNLRTEIDAMALKDVVSQGVQALWSEDESPGGRQFAMQIAGAFQIDTMQSHIAALATDSGARRDVKLAALRALREMKSTEVNALQQIASSPEEDEAVRTEALSALAESPSQRATGAILQLFHMVDLQNRNRLIERIAAHRTGAESLLAALEAGELDDEDIPVAAMEKMLALLPGNEEMEELWNQVADRLHRVLRLSGNNGDFAESVTLDGPFTVETWAQLSPGIGNEDGILGGAGVADMNFFGGRFRVWLGGGVHDIVVSQTETLPESWMHYAVTRDDEGIWRIYTNGELDAESTGRNTNALAGLHIGRTNPPRGTDGRLAEFRVWNVARTADQIRANFDRGFEDQRPEGLVHHYAGANWGQLHGRARIEPTLDAPILLTDEEARQQAEKFAHYRNLAAEPGDLARGRELFAKNCLTCHQQGGEGGRVGPPLDGVGLTGTEALLRNILTPSAAMEGGYRNFRVLTEDGRVVQGLLVSHDADGVVIRQPDTADFRIPLGEVERASFTPQSVMPAGLLEALQPQEVNDLLSYLLSLDQGNER